MKNIFFPMEIDLSIRSIPSSRILKNVAIGYQKMIKFYEVIFILLAKLNGVGMIVCRINRMAITGVKIDSTGNEGAL
jgi:hypothetical protein